MVEGMKKIKALFSAYKIENGKCSKCGHSLFSYIGKNDLVCVHCGAIFYEDKPFRRVQARNIV